jgi:exopolysaccharide production protein ExoQ
MRLIERGWLRHTYLSLALLVTLAGDAIRFTFGWWAFGVLAVLLAGASIWLLAAHRERWRFASLPYPLVAFLALATLSIIWSQYRDATALGLATTFMIVIAALAIAVAFSWDELLRALSRVLRFVLGLSLLFELFVSLVIRAPILPLFTQPGVDYSQYDTLPRLLYWSRNELFEVFDDGRIQGIVGNANNLGFLALLAVIVLAVQLADRSIGRVRALLWLGVAALTLALTRSATVTVALAGVIVVAAVVLLVRRATSTRAKALVYGAAAAGAAAGIVLAITLQRGILELLGKSADLTGRLGIWESVAALAAERPVVGWGWVSFWMPWAEPFDTLVFRNGVRQLQAHNAWLDVWFQLGGIGVILFAALVLSTLTRSWILAVDRPVTYDAGPLAYRALSLLPLLVLTALLVQSVAESRLLVEYGLLFLVVIAVKTKAGVPPDTSAVAR